MNCVHWVHRSLLVGWARGTHFDLRGIQLNLIGGAQLVNLFEQWIIDSLTLTMTSASRSKLVHSYML